MLMAGKEPWGDAPEVMMNCSTSHLPMLSVSEFHSLLARAIHDEDLADRILDLLELAEERLAITVRAGLAIGHAADLAQYGHDKYLPAAAAYLRHGSAHGHGVGHFRERRARLGGVSRRMYARQRKTFDDVLKLLPLASEIPAEIVDRLWHQVLELERRQLARARAAAAR
jgi:hypothetical protein